MACCGKTSPSSSPLLRSRAPQTIRVRVNNAAEEISYRKTYAGWGVERQAVGAGQAILVFSK